MNNIVNKIIVLAGATASGKTALASELIKKYPLEIVSADSRQIYKRLDIGTGKDKTVAQHMIDIEECRMQNAECRIKEGVPLYSVAKYQDKALRTEVKSPACYCKQSVAGRQKSRLLLQAKRCGQAKVKSMEGVPLYSVAKFRDMALKIIEEIWGRGKIPLIVGGTGFYIDALMYEQSTNNTPPNAKTREKLSKLNNEQLLDIINRVDPSTFSRIDQQNRARLIRAAEIVLETGKPIEPTWKQFRPNWDISLFVLDIQREELYKRIDKRVDARIEEGMIEEVVGLIESGVSAKWLLSLGLEYYWITRYVLSGLSSSTRFERNYSRIQKEKMDSCLRRNDRLTGLGEITKEEMILRLKFAIHAYARRQISYFKRWPNAKWGDDEYIQDKISTTCLN